MCRNVIEATISPHQIIWLVIASWFIMRVARGLGQGQWQEVILLPGLQLTSHFACLSLLDSSHQVFLSFLPFTIFWHMGLVNTNNNKADVKDSISSTDGKPQVYCTATLDTEIWLALATFPTQPILAVLATERSNVQIALLTSLSPRGRSWWFQALQAFLFNCLYSKWTCVLDLRAFNQLFFLHYCAMFCQHFFGLWRRIVSTT